MPDANNPAAAGTGEGASVAAGRDVLAEILGDQETDTNEDEATETAGRKAASESDRNATPGDDGDDGPDANATDDETQTDESKDGPARDESGKFVSPNAKWRLPDGTTTPVSELAKGYLRQSDYTQKTQAHSDAVKVFEAERGRVNELVQHLQTQHQTFNAWLEGTKPQRPKAGPQEDPLAHLQFNSDMQQWQAWKEHVDGQFRQTADQLKAKTTEDRNRYLASESEALFRAVPQFRDPGKRDVFVTEASKVFGDIGIKREEIAGLTDHRMILVLRDAMRWRRAQTRAPQVKADLDAKPQLIRGGKRDTPASKEQRGLRQLTERLAETGSPEDGRAVLARLIK